MQVAPANGTGLGGQRREDRNPASTEGIPAGSRSRSRLTATSEDDLGAPSSICKVPEAVQDEAQTCSHGSLGPSGVAAVQSSTDSGSEGPALRMSRSRHADPHQLEACAEVLRDMRILAKKEGVNPRCPCKSRCALKLAASELLPR